MYFSASKKAFLPAALRATYEAAGTWPSDAIKVTKADFANYRQSPPPEGMILGADEQGLPTWVPKAATPLDQLAQQKRAAIDTARDAAFAAGMPHDFPDGTTDMVQTRPEDKANLLGIAMKARDLRDAGNTEQVIKFRGASNETHALNAEQAIEMTNAALAYIQEIYEQSWQRKAAIEAAFVAEDRYALRAVI